MRENIISSVFIYLMSIYFLVKSFDLPIESAKFPRMVSILLIILTTIYVLQSIRQNSKESKQKGKDLVIRKLIYVFVTTSLYLISLGVLGYLISTPIYLVATMLLLGSKNKKTIFLVTTISVTLIYVGFKVLLNVPIPQGILF